MKNELLFKQYMMTLSEIHGREISPLSISIYWKTLEPFTDAECCEAFKKLIFSSKYFPKPVDFLEILQGKQEDRAARAWITVVDTIRRIGNYESVKFSDSIIHSVFEFWGGWGVTADWKDSELKWKMKEFEKLYTVMASNKKHPDHLPGVIEIENAAHGYDMPVKIIEIGFENKSKEQITAKGTLAECSAPVDSEV